jgi:hypothetical protein
MDSLPQKLEKTTLTNGDSGNHQNGTRGTENGSATAESPKKKSKEKSSSTASAGKEPGLRF